MNKPLSVSEKLFPLVSFAGLVFVSVELVMQLHSASVCGTEGCRVVAAHARYGDMAMLLPGIAVFLVLASLSAINIFQHTKQFDFIINTTLTASIIAEGFLVGYQVFRVHVSCIFCLSVFVVFVILGIMRSREGHKEIISGFAGFAIVFSLFYFVLPASTNCDCLGNNRIVLFYGKNCSHCEKIRELCDDCDLQITQLSVEEHGGFLKSVNINEVPVLLINDKTEKRMLIGEGRIRKYFLNNQYRKQRSAWVSEVFSSSAHAGTCKAGIPCKD